MKLTIIDVSFVVQVVLLRTTIENVYELVKHLQDVIESVSCAPSHYGITSNDFAQKFVVQNIGLVAP